MVTSSADILPEPLSRVLLPEAKTADYLRQGSRSSRCSRLSPKRGLNDFTDTRHAQHHGGHIRRGPRRAATQVLGLSRLEPMLLESPEMIPSAQAVRRDQRTTNEDVSVLRVFPCRPKPHLPPNDARTATLLLASYPKNEWYPEVLAAGGKLAGHSSRRPACDVDLEGRSRQLKSTRQWADAEGEAL
jgi:hypothetical protein